MRASSKRARWIPRVLLVLAATLLALAGAELAARKLLPESYYLVPPERRPRDVPALRPIGRGLHHVRAGWTEVADAEDELRVLFLGDSFTYGSGLADEAGTFVRRVEHALNERGDGRRVVCFNAGIPGSMTYDWRTLFEDAAPLFRPHLVVPVFFLRNGQLGARSIGEIGKMTAALEARHAESALFRRSRLVRFFAEQAEQRRLGRDYLAEMEVGYLGGPEEIEEWKQAQLNLWALREACTRAGAGFGVVVFPVLFGLDGEYALQRTVDEILRATEALGIPTLSLLPAFAGERAERLWVSKIDQHPNEDGHALAAAAIAPFVAERLAERAAGALAWPGAETNPAPTPEVPVDPALHAELERFARARGEERDALEAALVARGAELAPALAAALQGAAGTAIALKLLAALDADAFAAALPGFLAAAERNGAVALSSALPELRLGAAAAPLIADALARPAASPEGPESPANMGARIVLGRLDMYGNGLRSTWPLAGGTAPALAELLATARDARSERVTAIALGRLGTPAADALLPRLASADAAERARVAAALGYLGPRAPLSVTEPLAALLVDPDAEVRAAAARALWQIAPVSEPARSALERAAETDAAPEVRRWARIAAERRE